MIDRFGRNKENYQEHCGQDKIDYDKMYEQYKERLETQQDLEQNPMRRTNRKEVEAMNQRLLDLSNRTLYEEQDNGYTKRVQSRRTTSIQQRDNGQYIAQEQTLPVLSQFKNRKMHLATMPIHNREEMSYQEMMQYKLKSMQYRKSPKLDAMTRKFKFQCQEKTKLPQLDHGVVTEIPDKEITFGDDVRRAISRKGRASRNFRRSGLKNVFTDHNNDE